MCRRTYTLDKSKAGGGKASVRVRGWNFLWGCAGTYCWGCRFAEVFWGALHGPDLAQARMQQAGWLAGSACDLHPLCLLCCAAGHDAQKRCQEAALDCAEGLDNPACLKVRLWATCCRQWLSGVGGWAFLGAYCLGPPAKPEL